MGTRLNETDICQDPVDPGPCKQKLPKWYWDSVDCRCKKFYYSGCLGTRNRFNTKQGCVQECFYGRNASLPTSPRVPKILPTYTSYIKNFTAKVSNPACLRCEQQTSYCVQYNNSTVECKCKPGFEETSNGLCSDINECRDGLSDCNENAWCENTVGSFICECAAGYVGDGKTCESDLSQPDENDREFSECFRKELACDDLAICRNVTNSCICECPVGYAGNGYNCTNQTVACLDKFDPIYKEECDGEDFWRENYFYDHETKKCTLFWYNGCHGLSTNIFSQLSTCENLCEESNILKIAEEHKINII
uniref:Uncharacterized protein n=1 Tax=Acrobeloides nanus TaxID=290746 RepID=A0A914CI16_9BILA